MQQENNTIPKKKIIRISIICLAVVFALLVAAYIGISIYYTNHFSYNTWINGFYCTGLTADEALALVSSDDFVPSLSVVDYEGNEYFLDMSNVEYSYDYGTSVNELLTEQSPFAWPASFNNAKEYTIIPVFTVVEDDLNEAFRQVEFIAEEINRKAEYILYYSEDEKCYSYINNLEHRLDYKLAFDDLYVNVVGGNNTLVIDEDKYYINYEPDNIQTKTMERFNRIDAYQNCDLVFDMGEEQITFDPSLVLSFLIKDSNGLPQEDSSKQFILDEEKIAEWVVSLCEEYDTFDKPRSFKTTAGETVEVVGGTYGTIINPESEVAYLTDNLLKKSLHDGVTDIHEPEYLMKAYSRGKNDIGSIYVEVDISNQHLYYYENNECIISTDIVSGNVITRDDTITGTYALIAKDEERYILGVDFTSFVYYWMPFYDNFGLCDATWREEFGGDIYQTHGTHGQINMPLEAAEELFGKIEPGVPIVIY